MALTDDDKKWITDMFMAVGEGLNERFSKVEARLATLATTEALRDVETTLLTEFHKWASPREMRQHAQTVTLVAIEAELAELRDRVAKLEPKQ
jgi:hypothetical protein